jgi:hypothetical protein
MSSVEFGRVLFYPVTKVLRIDLACEMQLFYRSYEISGFNVRFPELLDVVRRRNCDYSRRSCSVLAMNCHNCGMMSIIHMFRALHGLLYSTPLTAPSAISQEQDTVQSCCSRLAATLSSISHKKWQR